uniref:NADH dehydrogenase [ubiquinone] 1 alpha subcomplex subunit 12 n=1 Tax=Salix viminalis TaxID=40686 RepID=A0A6N2KRN0_SALVM
MSKLLARIAGYLSNRTLVGVDKLGNRYYTKTEQIDGIMKEKRCVIFKGEEDPTSISVEWICWLNGQRRRAPTPEEQMELEARRELVKQNVALLKQEEEERRAKEGSSHKAKSTGKTGGPDLKSFIHQFPAEGNKLEEESDAVDRGRGEEEAGAQKAKEPLSERSEPTGSGPTFKPGTWQPPT